MSEQLVCKYCGKPLDLIDDDTVFTVCKECDDKLTRYYKWENNQRKMSYIVCPWCGYQDPDSWEFNSEYDDEYECVNCGKIFEVSQDVEIFYNSKKRKCDYEDQDSIKNFPIR